MSLLLPSSTSTHRNISSSSSTAPPFNSSPFSSSINSTANILTGAGPSSKTSAAAVVEHNPYALVLALIPILTIFGNSMVILAVRREKSLQTVTNYLIVSLASADLLVATCVMFFAVYFEWNSFVWDLGPTLCNLYIGADVACSTASILNLLAISIDRYIAISHPLAYCQIGTKNSRAYLSIALVWCFSIAVAVPVAFGANHIEQEHECSFTNPVFMIGSSLLSFFVPCLAMIALYAVIFRRLREREKARDMRKRGPTLGVDNALILNALMGGARMARQIAKSHLKDQLLLELSMQTSSFPTPSDEEEEEEEGEDEPEEHSDSEGSTQQRHKISSQNQMSSSNHKMSSTEANRRPTFCLMLNGGTGMPFPLAPMNPLTLPISGLLLDEEEAGKRPRRPSRHRKSRGAALMLRRCNTLPTAILRRPMSKDELGATKDVTEVNNNEPTMAFGVERTGNEEGRIGNGIGGEMYFMEGMLGRETPRPCSESASQFSLRDCPSSSFWHDDELSTQRSFGEGLQEDLPFIDSQSQSSSSSESSTGSGSTSSMDRRKWSESALTDPTATKARRRLMLEKPPIRAHSSYCGWPEDVQGEIKEAEVMEEEGEEEEERGEKGEKTKPIPLTVIQLASPQHNFVSANVPIKCQNTHQPVKRLFSSTVGPRLDLLDSLIGHQSAAPYQSMPNLLNNQFARLHSPLPIEKKDEEGEVNGMTEWLKTIMEWTKRNEEQKLVMGDHRIEVGFVVDEEKSNMTRTSIWRPTERRSASIGNRSVRIATGHGKNMAIKGFERHSEKLALSSVCPIPSQMPPPSSTSPLQRNGSCLMSAKSSSHQSPLQRIRNAFRRSLLAAMDEKRRPSRQLLKRATKQMRREQKATVTLAVVLAVFLCCWVPFFALHLSNALCLLSGGQQCVHLLAMFLSTWLGYLNSSLNPLIYTVFDKRFRKAFRELLAFCLGPPGIGGGLNRSGGGRARQR